MSETQQSGVVYMVKIRLRTAGGAVDCDTLFFDANNANEAHMLACDAMGKGVMDIRAMEISALEPNATPHFPQAFRLNHDRGVIVVFRSDIMSVNLMVMNTAGGV